MNRTFATRLQHALSVLDEASPYTTGKGMRLQNVMELIIKAAPGFDLIDRNTLDTRPRAPKPTCGFLTTAAPSFPSPT